jgi:hypothetical protein
LFLVSDSDSSSSSSVSLSFLYPLAFFLLRLAFLSHSHSLSASRMSHHHHHLLNQDLASCPISVLWDIENVSIPTTSAETQLTGSQIVLRMESALADLGLGPIHEFKAFLDIGKGHLKQEMRAELQCSNVMLVDATNVTQTKDLADKMLVVHMFSFALDHPPPATIVLISGDVDFAMPLAALRMRKYHIVLVLPLGRPVNAKLKNIAHKICYFQDILFPEKLYLPVELRKDPARSHAAAKANLLDSDGVVGGGAAAAGGAAGGAAAGGGGGLHGAMGDSTELGNLLTPQHLLKSRAELRAERPDLDQQQRAAKLRNANAEGSSRGDQHRQALVAANLARGIKCCTHCGKVNHVSSQCYFRPSKRKPTKRSKDGAVASSPPTRATVNGDAAASGAKHADDDNHHRHSSYSSDDDGHHGHHSTDDELNDDASLWVSLNRPVTTRYTSDDEFEDDHLRDDDGKLLSPQFIRSSGGAQDDNVSLLSEPAAEVHVRDLVDTLLDIREGGEARPLVSRIGNELARKYAFYRSGMATQLIELAAKSGIVTLHDNGLRRVELTADGMRRAASLIEDAAAAAPVPAAAPAAPAAPAPAPQV